MDFISDNEYHRVMIAYKDNHDQSEFLIKLIGNLAENNRHYKHLTFLKIDGT